MLVFFLLLLFSIGIFRLTDPSGLETILECKEKEAFHPHPDLPIYTVRLSCFFFFLFFFPDVMDF